MSEHKQVFLADVESAWWSKINWTQAVAMVATAITLISGNKYSLPPEVQLSIVAAIQAIQAVATWVMRTWFNPTVSPGSIK